MVASSDFFVDVLANLCALSFIQKDLGLVLGGCSHACNLAFAAKFIAVGDVVTRQIVRR